MFLFKCVLLLCALASSQEAEVQKFYIGGLFPNDISDPQDRVRLGVYPEIAAELAVRQVNEGGLLSAHNVSLEMLSFGSSCDQDTAVTAYLQLMNGISKASSDVAPEQEFSPPYVVLGPACDQPTYFTAALTSRYLKDIQISYSATTPLLSDTERFPLFYRTVPSYSNYGRAIFALMQHFDWLFVGVVHQEVSHYTRAKEDLNSLLTSSSSHLDKTEDQANVILSLGLNSYLTRSTNVSSSARIFIAMVPEDMAAHTLCTAYRTGMTGERFLWILPGDYREDWWREDSPEAGQAGARCTAEEMVEAVESSLILTHNLHLTLFQDGDVSSSERVRHFWQEFATLVSTTTDDPFRPQLATRVEPAYDAIWTIAHALEAVFATRSPQQSFSFSGRSTRNFTRELNTALERTDFEGLSGRIRFNSSSHSQEQPVTYILQMQSGHMIPIGIHSEEGEVGLNLTVYSNDLQWQGLSPPRDRPMLVLQSVSLWLIVAMSSLSLVGILYSVCVLIVNCIYRKHKVIKASSPYLNLVIILGCIMWLSTVPLYNLESLKPFFGLTVFPFFCNLRIWLTNIGFTMMFGAILTKTWRVYTIFRNPWTHKRPYKDHVLLGIVAVLVSYDLAILTLWVIIDPLFLDEEIKVDLEDFVERKLIQCTSQSFGVWLGTVNAPKVLFLLFGIFLVAETSKIKSKYFRDAKFIGITIFGFVLAYGVAIPVSLFGKFIYMQYVAYVAITTAVLGSTYLVLVMTFVPKFLLLKRYKKKIPSAVLKGLNPSYSIRKTNGTDSSSESHVFSETGWTTVDNNDSTEWESAFDERQSKCEVREKRLTFNPITSLSQEAILCEEDSRYVCYEQIQVTSL